MRIGTWNIHNAGAEKVPAIAAAVKAMDLDVIVLTEFTSKASGLREALGPSHEWWVETTPGEQQLGVAIASRLPMTDMQVIDPCAPWAGLLATEMNGLRLVGLYGPGKPSHIPGEKEKIKRRWWLGLLELCDQWRGEPTVLIGDFNSGINGEDGHERAYVHADLFEALPAHGFTDGWRQLHPNAREVWSFKSARYGWRRLDHVFNTDSVTIESAEYLHRVGDHVLVSDPDNPTAGAISDHAALVVEVSVRPSTRRGAQEAVQ